MAVAARHLYAVWFPWPSSLWSQRGWTRLLSQPDEGLAVLHDQVVATSRRCHSHSAVAHAGDTFTVQVPTMFAAAARQLDDVVTPPLAVDK